MPHAKQRQRTLLSALARRSIPERKVLVAICAYNEEENLRALLPRLKGYDVLVVDDGSTDGTYDQALREATYALRHGRRLGKAASLCDALSFARRRGYDTFVAIDADALPEPGAIEGLVRRLGDDVGGVSARQVPLGRRSLAYFIDELIWSCLDQAKRLQMAWHGYAHLGSVMYAVRLGCMGPIGPCVNDDEAVGISLISRGYTTIYAPDAVVYFDASSCLGHLMQRRVRMCLGHLLHRNSPAPSVSLKASIMALARSVLERPRRLVWVLPACIIEIAARIRAWSCSRTPANLVGMLRWVTSFPKVKIAAIAARELDL